MSIYRVDQSYRRLTPWESLISGLMTAGMHPRGISCALNCALITVYYKQGHIRQKNRLAAELTATEAPQRGTSLARARHAMGPLSA